MIIKADKPRQMLGLERPTCRLVGEKDYLRRALSLGPSAYWPLDDIGATARNLVDPAMTGANTFVITGKPGVGDGRTSCGYRQDADPHSRTHLYSASFAAMFELMRGEGSLAQWVRIIVLDAVFTECPSLYLSTNFSGQVGFFNQKPSASLPAVLRWRHRASPNIYTAEISSTGYVLGTWMHLGCTWSVQCGRVRHYLDGRVVGSYGPVTPLPGTLYTTRQAIGAVDGSGTNPVNGDIQHTLMFTREIDLGEMAYLALIR